MLQENIYYACGFEFYLSLKPAITQRMTEPNPRFPDLGRQIFRCRPKPLRTFFALRCQGSFPLFRWWNSLNPIIVGTSSIAETLILAGMPTILLIFVLQIIFG